MMRAALDVGTNTVRLLIGEVRGGRIEPFRYFRRITRLGGGFSPSGGLDPAAVQRTFSALREAASLIADAGVTEARGVGTAVLRAAPDGEAFAAAVRAETGIPLEIIPGEEEARLSAMGVRAVLDPMPERCLIMDVGGGSTEFILWEGEGIRFSRSYPVGVVVLSEACADAGEERRRIDEALAAFIRDLRAAGAEIAPPLPLVGTAGTVTTLAALKLRMTEYDWRRVNNLVLTAGELDRLAATLEALSVPEREALPGMEEGRGDLILPGLRIVRSVLDLLGGDRLVVSDSGLLEGVLLAWDEKPTSGRNH